MRAIAPLLAPLVDAAMRVTFAPTIVSAGEKINVIPARAMVRVDCRVPPEMGEDVALRRAREVIGDDDEPADRRSPRPSSATARRSSRR